MSRIRVDMPVGSKWEMLTVTGPSKKTRKGKRMVKCDCDCGGKTEAVAADMRSGNTGSCGCRVGKANLVHGMSTSPTGRSWMAMLARCFKKSHVYYHFYGGAGVKVCEFIRNSPVNIVMLIGLRPHGKTLDRKNPAGNYSCGRCAECLEKEWPMNIRWATMREQGRNKKNTVYLTIRGKTKSLMEWAEILKIKHYTLRRRYLVHGNNESKLTAPVVGRY